MHAYIINLARSSERRAKITAMMDKYGIDYEIVNAIDAQDHDFNAFSADTVVSAFYDKFRPGEAACALSHMSVYREILADGLDWGLVLEDDIVVPPELMRIANAVAACLAGAEVALLNFDSEEVVRVSRVGAVDLPSARQLVTPVDARQPASGAAYVIRSEER